MATLDGGYAGEEDEKQEEESDVFSEHLNEENSPDQMEVVSESDFEREVTQGETDGLVAIEADDEHNQQREGSRIPTNKRESMLQSFSKQS